MNITESMLKRWLEIPKNIFDLTNQHIIEVESFKPLIEASNLVTGHVLTCEKHPNADTLSLTTVDLGNEVTQIVCGAANVAAGQYVIVAKPGAVLPGDFEIKPTKIRGIESNGMICSLEELAIPKAHIPKEFASGIYYFDKPVKLGISPLELLGLAGFNMELSLTPNRGDLLSVLGFAYDLAAMLDVKVNEPKFKIVESGQQNPIEVQIDSPGCGRYYTRFVESLELKESPLWLKMALLANQIEPINVVIDISNYVMLEYGVPLHMFDYQQLRKDKIIIRDAHKNEKVVLLNSETKVLNEEDVVITNNNEVIAIAGIMGCENSMISDKTKSVVIEAAYFDSRRIAKSSKRLNIKSEASLRYERGLDDKRVETALNRATELLIELADAKIAKGVNSQIVGDFKTPMIKITVAEINQLLGTILVEDQVVDYLARYRYTVSKKDDELVVKAPNDRKDIAIKADVIEEIARIYGLNRIELQPVLASGIGKLSKQQKMLRKLRHFLANLGLHEAINYSLLDEKEVYHYAKIGETVKILQPLSDDKNTLRQSLITGLLNNVSYHYKRQISDVALFEIGHVFAKGIETQNLSVIASGNWHQYQLKKTSFKADFALGKGILNSITQFLGVEFRFEATKIIDRFHPYRQAKIIYKDQPIGYIAEVHPSVSRQLKIDQTVVFEINLDSLANEKPFTYQPVSRYPSISRDLALLVDVNTEAQVLFDMIHQTAGKHLIQLDIFDVYQGENIPENQKSIAFRLLFNHTEQTLENDAVDSIMKRISKRLKQELNAVVR